MGDGKEQGNPGKKRKKLKPEHAVVIAAPGQ